MIYIYIYIGIYIHTMYIYIYIYSNTLILLNTPISYRLMHVMSSCLRTM